MSLKVWLHSACDIEAVRPRHLFSLSHVQSAVLWSKRGFPGGTVLYVKNLPAIAGDTGDTSSIPGSGRSSGVGNGNPLTYSWKFHGQRSLVGYNPCSHKESHMTKHVRTHTHKHTHTHRCWNLGTMTSSWVCLHHRHELIHFLSPLGVLTTLIRSLHIFMLNFSPEMKFHTCYRLAEQLLGIAWKIEHFHIF